jgi:predicted nucleic-acid-binding protein
MERVAEEPQMKAVDTNVLVRYVVRDDPQQFAKAAAFLEQRTPNDPAFVSLVVLVELVWALRRRYRYSREQVHSLVLALLETAEITFEEEQFLSTLINGNKQTRGDIADHLIAFSAARAGAAFTATFDRQAAKVIPSMELLA